jgi:hypothetical protein
LDIDPATGDVYVAGIVKLTHFLLFPIEWLPSFLRKRFTPVSAALRILKTKASDQSIYFGRPYTVETLLVDGTGRFPLITAASAYSGEGYMLVTPLWGRGIGKCTLSK